ncbi:hypothetical protein ACLKMH_00730 [Psychromonas sp. KJ10-10]|uniref:hypothetical protein n=1 Tax=Psychromonas sp. KJ10-10 TaxID=3391823 RepID=UPI0039B3ECA1
MRILLSTACLFLLSSCAYQPGKLETDSVEENPSLMSCEVFPYDESDEPCNLVGWQAFAYQVLNATEEEHRGAFLLLMGKMDNHYKQIILRSSHFEPDDIRQQAIEKMFQISSEYNNGFGQLFYLLATYSNVDHLNKQKIVQVEKKLKVQTSNNVKLKKQLKDTQAKIQAIMDIEQDLNTN